MRIRWERGTATNLDQMMSIRKSAFTQNQTSSCFSTPYTNRLGLVSSCVYKTFRKKKRPIFPNILLLSSQCSCVAQHTLEEWQSPYFDTSWLNKVAGAPTGASSIPGQGSRVFLFRFQSLAQAMLVAVYLSQQNIKRYYWQQKI